MTAFHLRQVLDRYYRATISQDRRGAKNSIVSVIDYFSLLASTESRSDVIIEMKRKLM
jgi:hypothetical protein